MPLKEYQSTAYSDLKDNLEKLNSDEDEVFIFFSCTLEKHGDPTTKTCYEADDTLMEYIDFVRNSKRTLHLIIYRTQLEDYSKFDSEVYKDNSLRIVNVPTLIKWKGYQRLVGVQCCKFPLLSMLFEKECQEKFPLYEPCQYFTIKEEEPEEAGINEPTDENQDAEGKEEPAHSDSKTEQPAKPDSKTEQPAKPESKTEQPVSQDGKKDNAASSEGEESVSPTPNPEKAEPEKVV